jgi:hypothetical protein
MCSKLGGDTIERTDWKKGRGSVREEEEERERVVP